MLLRDQRRWSSRDGESLVPRLLLTSAAAVLPNTATEALGEAGQAAARRLLEASGVEQLVPRPRVGDWWQELLGRVATFVANFLDFNSATLSTLLTVVAWGVIAVAGVSLLLLVVRAFRRSGSAAKEHRIERIRGRVGAEYSDVEGWSRQWNMRLDAALKAGDLSAAIEALWFVIASRLRLATGTIDTGSGVAVAPRPAEAWMLDSGEWTGRKLLALAGGFTQRLRPAVRELERATYGERRASMEEVLALRAAINQALPEAASKAATMPPGAKHKGELG